MDTRLLKDSFDAVADRGPELTEWFYAHLFYKGGPEVRDMFPPFMTAQRDRLLGALVRIVTSVDDLDGLAAYLSGLGRDHRKFGVAPEHYDLVGQSLLATLERFAGEAWTREVAETWVGAYSLVAQVMRNAAAEEHGPPWWDGVVTDIEMRPPDVALVAIRLTQPMTYLAGQSMAVQFEGMPRVWRFYSPANAPVPATQEMVFHVRAVDGGMLSTALALRARPGDKLRLGPPVGNLKLAAESRDLLLVAGSTGLAPLQSIVEQVASRPEPPRTDLFFGARSPEGLYVLPELEKFASQHPWLTITPAVSGGLEDGQSHLEHGSIVDVMARKGPWNDRAAYICGPTGMVTAARERLTALGLPRDQIHVEDFGLVEA